MAGTPHGSEDPSLITPVVDWIVHTGNYAVTLQAAHLLATFVTAAVGGAVAATVPRLFKGRVSTEAVVHGETFLEYSGVTNPDTDQEYIDQVLHTYDEFTLHDIFKKSSMNPDRLVSYFKKAAAKCTKEKRIVFSHLPEILSSDGKLLKHLPYSLSKRLGYMSEEDKKKTLEEIARCWRNFHGKRLTPDDVERQPRDQLERTKLEWHRKIAMLVYEPGTEGKVFRSLIFDPSMLDFKIPEQENVRLMFNDPEHPTVKPGHYLYDRLDTLYSMTAEIKENYDYLKQFFVRYTLGNAQPVPEPQISAPS